MEEFDDLFQSESADEKIENNRLQKRYIRDMQSPLHMYENIEFERRYRFTKECAVNVLLPLVEVRLTKMNNRGLPIIPIIQLLTTFRFYGSNSFQLVHGDVRGLSQSTVSRVVRNVTVCLAEHLQEFVRFPQNDAGFAENIAAFYRIANFPRVSACIDCSHIRIENPGGNKAEVFRNRKGWFCLNVQVACGPNLEIMDIVVRHPGSTHDSVIFNRSALRTPFELQQVPGLLLGDNGYASTNYLLTPVLNPETRPERRYNAAHIRTRNTVERAFGIWKRRFACLKNGLRTKMDTSVAIICATAVLYNIGITHNQNQIIDVDEGDANEMLLLVAQNNNGGLAFRRAFINTHFND